MVEEEADDAVQEGQKHGWGHGEQGRPVANPTLPKPSFDDPHHGQSAFVNGHASR
jgi:hypothetical protein